MTQLIKNAARAALAAGIAAADTSLTVDITKADLFPAANTGTDPVNTVGKDWFKIVVEDASHNYEIMYVRTRTLGSAVMSNLLRGQEGTTAISFAAGSIVGLRITADDYESALDLAAVATTFGKSILAAADAAATRVLLGFSTFFSGLIGVADAAAARTALGVPAASDVPTIAQIQNQTHKSFTTGGTSTAFTGTPSPATAATAADQEWDVTFHTAPGLNSTLAISGKTPKNLKYRDSTGAKQAITSTQVPSGWRSPVVDDGTDYIVREIVPSIVGYLTGQVVQVVSVTKTDTWSTSSTSMVDVTGLSAAITPRKSSNKILAILSLALNGQSTVSAHAQLVLSGVSAIGIGDAASARTRSTITSVGNAAYVSGSHTAHFLHSPGSASALTYKVQAMTGQGGTTAYVNRSQNDADSADSGRGISTLTLLEIDA